MEIKQKVLTASSAMFYQGRRTQYTGNH